VLDRFMKQRIIEKGIPEGKLAVIPPWSHTDSVRYDSEGRIAFRGVHDLSEKFVVMYSGNHSPCHPLDTLLGAASKLADQKDIVFCFVGGGSEYDKVQAYAQQNELKNIICLPYQPLNELAMSLSAADLHVVVMGDPFTGIVHPCKIYNILEIGSPVLYVGPRTSHIVEVISKLEDRDLVCSVRHGDVDAVANFVLAGSKSLAGRRSQSAMKVGASFSREALLPRIVELIDLVPQQRFKSSAVVSDTKAQWLS
jgi:glycosyltransferase involved in cell wall biosynthesis